MKNLYVPVIILDYNQASFVSLKKVVDHYSQCPSFTGLWLSSVPVVWHAAGDEGAIWWNPAEEMEYHLQVESDVHVASGWECHRVYLRATRAQCTLHWPSPL